VFGFDLDSNNTLIGNCYILLMGIYNLIGTPDDSISLIDSKGQYQGKVKYSLDFEIFEQYKDELIKVEDLLDFD